ncbi:MAG: hypothetical protein AAF517_26175 [Planctomycetota bacterium]
MHLSLPRRRSVASAVCGLAGLLASCSAPPSSGPLVDPSAQSLDGFGNDMGTLISSADVRSAAQEMVQSMNASEKLSRLRKDGALTLTFGSLRQFTTVTNFDKRLFVNRLIGNLNSANPRGGFRFVDRAAVAAERGAQLRGDVTGTPEALKGAGYVLSGEIREILHHSQHESGGETEKRTVQYALRVTDVASAEILWSHSYEVVKEQLIGVAYR